MHLLALLSDTLLRYASPMSTKSAKDACWSFSLRDYNYADDFSSSDDSDDAEDGSGTAHPRSEANLLQELDIASRQDTANYRPNPWSIAKANAASRPSVPNTSRRPSFKTVTGGTAQSTVPNVLHNQPPKPNLSSKNASLSWSDNPPIPTQPGNAQPTACEEGSLNFEENAHIPSDETLVDDSFSDKGSVHKLSSHKPPSPSLVRSRTPLQIAPTLHAASYSPLTSGTLSSSSPLVSNSSAAASFATLKNSSKGAPKQDLRSLLFYAQPSKAIYNSKFPKEEPNEDNFGHIRSHGAPIAQESKFGIYYLPKAT